MIFCQYDRHATYYGLKNTYSFEKDGVKIVLAPLKMSLSPKLSLEKSNIVFESMFVATLAEYVIACALVLVEGNKEDQEHLEDIHPLLNEYNDVGQKRSLHVYL